jgi:hypothetical protein
MKMLVARKLHERRYRANPVMTTGELLNLIGQDGMQEALNQRWLVPDPDTSFLTLNQHGGKLLELENACRCACGKTDCNCPEAVEAQPSYTMPMREDFAGFGLPRPSGLTGAPQAPMLPRPQAPLTPTSPAPGGTAPKINDKATVREGNDEYEGIVSGFEDDGRLRLRWTGRRPSKDRAYGPYEVQVKPATDQHA